MEFKESRWWALLPLVVMFVCFFIGYEFVPTPVSAVWWGIPLVVTLGVSLLYSIVVASVLWPLPHVLD